MVIKILAWVGGIAIWCLLGYIFVKIYLRFGYEEEETEKVIIGAIAMPISLFALLCVITFYVFSFPYNINKRIEVIEKRLKIGK